MALCCLVDLTRYFQQLPIVGLVFFWLCWVFIAACGLSLVVTSGGYSWLRCTGFSLQWLLVAEHGLQARGLQQLQHVGSVVVAHGLQSTGSVVVAHGLSRSAVCGIFSDQGSNPCCLHWQADSQPLRHQGSPEKLFLNITFLITKTFKIQILNFRVYVN